MQDIPYEIAQDQKPGLQGVENALIKRAVGFEYHELRIETQAGKEKRTETIKYQPPDMAAIKFYLQNRCPERWKEGGGDEDVPIELVVLRSDEE